MNLKSDTHLLENWMSLSSVSLIQILFLFQLSHLEKNSMNAFDIFYTLYSLMTRNMVNGLLIFTQFGLGCVYVVFIASNVKEVTKKADL